MNSAKEGMTSQKMFDASEATLFTSLVSIYSHTMAITETRGIEAKIAATTECLLETSEMSTINIVVITIFTM